MLTYVGRRLLQMVPLVFGISVILFAVIQMAPGGPEGSLLETGRFIDPEVIEAYRERLGVDRPVHIQYVRWLSAVSFLGIAMPVFWFALILQMVFSVQLGWLPVAGTETVGDTSLGDHLKHLILPAVVLSFRNIAGWSRYLRASLLGVLRADYIRTARAKGLSERAVVGVHGVRNALIPVLSIMALGVADMFSGAVITETIFAWPGIGRMFVQAMFARDYPLLMGIMIMGSMMVIVFNLVADVLYGVLDPRIRYA